MQRQFIERLLDGEPFTPLRIYLAGHTAHAGNQ